MKSLIKRRQLTDISQRSLAIMAAVSYKTIQLLESSSHDPRLSTLRQIAKSLGYPPQIVEQTLSNIFEQPQDSILIISWRIYLEGESSWKIWLFNFVDGFRTKKDVSYINSPPIENLSDNLKAMLASTVETLCEEQGVAIPMWCKAVLPLKEPWFVADMENLKVLALRESPIYFRKRNIFVLENFLSRR